MASKARGTMKQGNIIEVEVVHGERDSYGRSVIPTATANVTRLGLWAGWKGYDVNALIDAAVGLGDGMWVTTVRFTRTR